MSVSRENMKSQIGGNVRRRTIDGENAWDAPINLR